MATLTYTAITSLDGYVADKDGDFDWSVPDEAVHRVINDLQRPIGIYLYGRRLYDVMLAWEPEGAFDEEAPFVQDFATIWRAADKIVYSRTLESASSARTRIQRSFDPEAIRQFKATAGTDISVGGAELAAQALTAGLVDEIHLFVSPVVVGGGTPALPADVELRLQLLGERSFDNGVVHLHYAIQKPGD